jgi:hypothetical protein
MVTLADPVATVEAKAAPREKWKSSLALAVKAVVIADCAWLKFPEWMFGNQTGDPN